MKKFFLFALMALVPVLQGWAYDFEVDGIYYTLTGTHTVSVDKGAYDYEGDVTIPANVANGGHTYTVTAIADNAFNSMKIENVVLPEGLTTIGNSSFQSSTLKSITLPSTLSSMGTSAFESCTGLTAIVLPDAIKEVREYAFENCTNLKMLTIGENVVNIEQRAFRNTAIEKLVIPSSMKIVGPLAFSVCKNLKSLIINDAAVMLDKVAFADCTCLENIELGSAVLNFGSGYSYIGDSRWPSYSANGGPFVNCSALSKVVIPESVSKLDATFRGCSRLYDVTLPNTIKEIGAYTFADCAIRELSLPSDISSIGNNAFENCPISTIELPSGLKSISSGIFKNCPLREIVIPSLVESIDKSAFEGCPLTSVELPSKLKTIGESAFRSCPLEEIVIPQSVTLIDNFAFDDCYSLKRLKIENAPVTIIAAFRNCTALEDVDLGNALVSFGSNSYGCFNNCTNLTKVSIPSTVTCIAWGTFSGCKSLKTLNLPNTLQKIEQNAFQGCTSLTEIFIPESVTSIGTNAFQGCSNVESVVFDNSVLDIQEGTFADCTKLKTISLGKVTSIGKHAFQNCTQLERVEIPNSVESLFSSFIGCTALKEVIIGKGVKELTNTYYDYHGVFQDCTKLVSVKFNTNKITTLSSNSFRNCRSLKKIEIPASVTTIGENAFNGCNELSHIYMNPTTPPGIDGTTFSDYNTPTLHVPADAKTAYTKADNWKNFTNVVAIGSEAKVSTEDYAALEALLIQAQALYNGAVEGTEPGNYRPGAKAALKAAIEEVESLVSPTMLAEDAAACTELLNNAMQSFRNKQVKNDIQTNNTLSFAGSLKAAAGSEFRLPIEMNNTDAITGVQFDLYLSEGLTLSEDEYGDYNIELSNRTTIRRHSVASRVMADGALRVVVSSTQNATFDGNSGTLLTLVLFPKSTLESGDYDVELKNIILTDPQATRYAAPDMKSVITVSNYTMGDVNNDGHIDVADLAGVVRFILENADASLVFNAADMDGNGVIEINDYAALVNVILSQDASSNAPRRKANAMLRDIISLSALSLDSNGEGELTVSLPVNDMRYTGMQFDLRLPEGIELADDGADAVDGCHGAWMQRRADGTYRIVCASMMNDEFATGEVMRLQVKATAVCADESAVVCENVVLSDVDAVRHEAASASAMLSAGDATGVSAVNANRQMDAYDLQGRRAGTLKRGLYIVNGKKVVVK